MVFHPLTRAPLRLSDLLGGHLFPDDLLAFRRVFFPWAAARFHQAKACARSSGTPSPLSYMCPALDVIHCLGISGDLRERPR